MIEIRRILCPIDFSDFSRHALDHAVAVARRYESSITVVHVLSMLPVAAYTPGMPSFEPVILTPEDREELLAEMKRFVAASSAPGIPVSVVIREGDTTTEILSLATDMKADLLVLGTHGRSGFERFLLGSITEKLLRKASCPVLTVPRRHPDAVPAATVLFKRILCPVDFSHCSMEALNYAMSLAQEADARLTVLHVMPYDMATPDMYGAMIANDRERLADYRRRSEAEARQQLNDSVPEAVRAYCTVETLVAAGKADREILRVAAEQQPDVIVVGVQGRGAVDLTFFGSTTNHVVREATCPVLTVRRP